MPHVDLKYKPNVLSGEVLFATAEKITEIIGAHFNENPAFVRLRWYLKQHGPGTAKMLISNSSRHRPRRHTE